MARKVFRFYALCQHKCCLGKIYFNNNVINKIKDRVKTAMTGENISRKSSGNFADLTAVASSAGDSEVERKREMKNRQDAENG